MKSALETSRRPLLGILLIVALVGCAAIPASASARFNDDFADSVAQPDGGGKDWVETFSANLSSVDKETGEPNHAGFAGGHSVWISWEFFEDTDAQASACGANGADLLIAVYTGSAVNELTEVASQSEETEAGCAVVRFDAEKGTTYRIAVDAKSSPGTSSMYLEMGRYPANDDFVDAIVLPEFPTSVSVDPGLGSPEAGEPPAEKGPGNSVWYRWTAGKSGLASISNCAKWPGLYATVFTGPALEGLTQVGEQIFNGGICDETRFEAEEGTTYSIRIAGYTGKGDKMSVAFTWVGKALLTVSKSGSGSGTVVSEPTGIECGGSCEASYYWGPLDYGEIPFTLTATPDPGSVFVGWSGKGWSGLTWSPLDDWGEPECGSEPVCEFLMIGTPAEVTAEFEAVPSLVITGGESRSDTLQSTPPSPAPAASLPQASPPPHRKKPKCAERKKNGKKKAKASKRRRACKR